MLARASDIRTGPPARACDASRSGGRPTGSTAATGTLGAVLLPLMVVVLALCAILGAWALWFTVRDRAVILKQLWGAAVVEGVLLVQIVVSIVLLVQGWQGDAIMLWGYHFSALLILPIAALVAFVERTRWSSVVLLVATLTVAFLEVRLWQIWELGA